MSLSLTLVTGGPRLEAVRQLFREYADAIGVDLCFQGFAEELAQLPGRYAPPDGRLLLAEIGQEPAGCAALRRLDGECCEMKRLYVRPAFRGLAVGARLVERLINEARHVPYRHMRLDTLPSMRRARALYQRLGFRAIPAYYDNPVPGAVFMELDLAASFV